MEIKAFILSFILGIIFSYSGLAGFTAGFISGFIVCKNSEDKWVVVEEMENKPISLTQKLKNLLSIINE